jgi:hypothetical protein
MVSDRGDGDSANFASWPAPLAEPGPATPPSQAPRAQHSEYVDLEALEGNVATTHPKTDLAVTLAGCCATCWDALTTKSVVMASGLRVYQGRLLAEGGFSFVFYAKKGRNTYALK